MIHDQIRLHGERFMKQSLRTDTARSSGSHPATADEVLIIFPGSPISHLDLRAMTGFPSLLAMSSSLDIQNEFRSYMSDMTITQSEEDICETSLPYSPETPSRSRSGLGTEQFLHLRDLAECRMSISRK